MSLPRIKFIRRDIEGKGKIIIPAITGIGGQPDFGVNK